MTRRRIVATCLLLGGSAVAFAADPVVNVIVEGQVMFDLEITLLTVRAASGTHICEPIGHVQVDGDYV